MSRYFFAVIPPEPAQSAIEAFRARWGHPHHNVEPHITVKAPFQWPGDPEAFLAPVRAVCAAHGPIKVRLGQPARFGDAVLFLTVESPLLKHLHIDVINGVPTPGDPLGHEGEGYTPHLTLAVTRFGISADGLDRMEAEARAELTAVTQQFFITALRCYHRQGKDDRWIPLCDLPLGSL
ncbi:MAG TPA: 2'-5' RNA ligase family protein [Symbiobacteriaceae bacterium]|nr:2'-5' RNA ligase family protein [Symbiobacteriaceae bacterium]